MTQVASVQSPMVYGRTMRAANVASKPAQTSQPVKAASVAAASTKSASVEDLCDAGDDKQAVYAQQMKRCFMSSPGSILFMNSSPFMRSISSFLTGVPKEDLKEFAYRADLMRVPGMTADSVRTIRNPLIRQMTDIKGPADLANSSIASILSLLNLLGVGGDLAKASAIVDRAKGMDNKVK